MPRCWRCNSFVTQYQQWLPSHPARLHHTQQVHGLWCTVSQTLGLSPMLPYQGNVFPISLNTWNIQWYTFLTNWSSCYFSHNIHWSTWYTNAARLCGFLNSFHSCCTTATSINCSHSVFSSFQHLSSASNQNCTSTHIPALKHSTTFCNQLTAEKRIFLDLGIRLPKAEI